MKGILEYKTHAYVKFSLACGAEHPHKPNVIDASLF